MNNPDVPDRELAVLENILYSARENQGDIRQRDLAHVVGISLGMTNTILRRLAKKGWLKLRRINSRRIQYAITSAGMEEIARKSFRFLKQTVRDIVIYKGILEELVVRIKASGYKGIALAGNSEFDFIIEHLCTKHRLGLVVVEQDACPAGHFLLVSDAGGTHAEEALEVSPANRAFLKDMLTGS